MSDSLAGRIESILLSPLSECEIHHTKPQFLSMVMNADVPILNKIANKKYLINRIVTGCFPEPLQRKTGKRIKAWYKQYINSLIQKDIKELDHIDHPDKMLKLLSLAAYYSGKLINYSDIGAKVNLTNETAKKYIHLVEQFFLLKFLPAWHSNQYKRLIKTPKLYLVDTGLACAIRDIDEDYLSTHPGEIGSLLETFVINELQKQAAWLEQDVFFYHYRDKDKVEVDCIIENARGDCFAIEVKASATLSAADFKGIKRFQEISKERFKLGILLYDGEHILPFGENLYAVPIYALWS